MENEQIEDKYLEQLGTVICNTFNIKDEHIKVGKIVSSTFRFIMNERERDLRDIANGRSF